MNDRIIGIIILFLSICYGLTAFGFKLEFVTDPLGPSKYPILLSFFSIILCLYLIIFPGRKIDVIKWKIRPIPIFIVSLLFYIFILWLSGFLIATILYITFLSMIAGSKFLKGFITAIIFSFTVYLFFVSLLKLHLPTSYIIDILK